MAQRHAVFFERSDLLTLLVNIRLEDFFFKLVFTFSSFFLFFFFYRKFSTLALCNTGKLVMIVFGTHCQVSPSCALLRTVDPFKANVKTRRSIEAQRERIDRRVVGVQVQGGWGRAHALVLNTSRVVNLNYNPRSPGSPRLRPIRQPVCINFLSTSCVSYLFIIARNKL